MTSNLRIYTSMAYILIFTSLIVSTFIPTQCMFDGMFNGIFNTPSPRETFLTECEELITHLRPHEHEFYMAIYYSDIEKMNDLLASYALSLAPVTTKLHACLRNTLIITYPELFSEQQNPLESSALKMTGTLLNYHTICSKSLPGQNRSDDVSHTAYKQLFELYSAARKDIPLEYAQAGILTVMQNISNAAQCEQLYLVGKQQNNDQDQDNDRDNGNEESNEEYGEKQDSDTIQQKNSNVSPAQTISIKGLRQEECFKKRWETYPYVSNLLLSERDSLFREFKHLPA